MTEYKEPHLRGIRTCLDQAPREAEPEPASGEAQPPVKETIITHGGEPYERQVKTWGDTHEEAVPVLTKDGLHGVEYLQRRK